MGRGCIIRAESLSISIIRTFLPVLALSAALPLITSCSGTTPSTSELKVGVFVYDQGKAQSCCGDATMNVVEMVRDELEEAGGITVDGRKTAVRILTVGIENKPEDAVIAAQRLINQEGVHALIGPQHSGDAIPVAEIAQKSGIIMISPMSTNPGTTRGKDNVFRIGFLDDFQGDVLARLAYSDLGARRAAILYDKARPYNTGIAQRFSSRFKGLEGDIVVSQTYVTGQVDFSDQLAAVKSKDPDLLLLPNHNNDVLLQGQQVREAGIDSILLGTDAWDEQQLASLLPFEGAYKVAHWSETVDSDRSREFVSVYTRRFGTKPNNTAALTYDAFQILFEAAAYGGSVEAPELRRALYELPPFGGLSGQIDYVKTGDPVKGAVVLKLSQGKVLFHKMYQP